MLHGTVAGQRSRPRVGDVLRRQSEDSEHTSDQQEAGKLHSAGKGRLTPSSSLPVSLMVSVSERAMREGGLEGAGYRLGSARGPPGDLVDVRPNRL